jgi:hypothetical protein
MNLIRYRNHREHNKTSLLIGLCILFYIFIVFRCAERDRSNIFDPSSGIDSLDISLYITSADSVITIRWNAPNRVHFIGYNLYRKTLNDNEFQLIASPLFNQLKYVDKNISSDITYQYYIRVVGEDNESPPSKILRITPGPLSFFVLDRWAFALYQLTYDVQHILSTRYTTWSPENIALDSSEDLIMITYPQLRYYDIFSRNLKTIILSGSEFNRPFDCIYDTEQKKFWITDSSGFLYSINPITGISQLIDQNLIRPTQIIQTNQGIFIIDVKAAQIIRYNNAGQRQDVIDYMGESRLLQPIYINYAGKNAELYIIDKVNTEDCILYRYSLLSDSVKVIYQNKYMNCIQIDQNNNSVWISINESENSVLMQLSLDGIRLNEIDGFSGISDFKFISETNTIVVADPVDNLVKHLRPNSSVIGVFDKAVYPAKVYVE